jgi:hypothetical protein
MAAWPAAISLLESFRDQSVNRYRQLVTLSTEITIQVNRRAALRDTLG